MGAHHFSPLELTLLDGDSRWSFLFSRLTCWFTVSRRAYLGFNHISISQLFSAFATTFNVCASFITPIWYVSFGYSQHFDVLFFEPVAWNGYHNQSTILLNNSLTLDCSNIYCFFLLHLHVHIFNKTALDYILYQTNITSIWYPTASNNFKLLYSTPLLINKFLIYYGFDSRWTFYKFFVA